MAEEAAGGIDWSGKPAYRQVADKIRDRIKKERLAPGTQLPSNAEIMDQYGVSITVARLAFKDLKAEGIVAVAPGKGNFVADPKAGGDKTEQFERAMRLIGTLVERVDDLSDRLATVEERIAQPDPSAAQGPRSARRGQR